MTRATDSLEGHWWLGTTGSEAVGETEADDVAATAGANVSCGATISFGAFAAEHAANRSNHIVNRMVRTVP